MKFRDSQKLSNQSWVDCVEYSRKEVEGWVKGSNVGNYNELFDFGLKEHMFRLCFPELCQHLIDSKLTVFSELTQEANL